MSEIRIIIADDHPIVRQGLRQVIEREADLNILAEAADGEAALEQIVALKPEVAVLDLDMPLMDGLELLRVLRERALAVAVIMLTVHREEAFFNRALELGAQGYMLKDSALADIVNGIRAVAAGQNYVSPLLTSYLFQQRKDVTKTDRPALEQLTQTERQVLQLIAEYKTNNQIAQELYVSPLTVKTHRRNISIKLGLEGKHTLMKFALDNKAKL
ncbi:MAG TPA: response regulator transcription factor [Pyrinomonadaceae bacterium]|jgi:DNA-binding NarL/FixJ family response regulator|nr:response regulator transcription factor [Pyrinomonadaceae bacterium]